MIDAKGASGVPALKEPEEIRPNLLAINPLNISQNAETAAVKPNSNFTTPSESSVTKKVVHLSSIDLKGLGKAASKQGANETAKSLIHGESGAGSGEEKDDIFKPENSSHGSVTLSPIDSADSQRLEQGSAHAEAASAANAQASSAGEGETASTKDAEATSGIKAEDTSPREAEAASGKETEATLISWERLVGQLHALRLVHEAEELEQEQEIGNLPDKERSAISGLLVFT